MREIKFRAWDLESKIMWSHEELAAADPEGVMSFHHIIGGRSHGMVAMQYTGLEEKNGREIYEGDIACDEEGPYFVQWCEKYGYWAISTPQVECCDYLSEWLDDFKAIGSIHENPELLEATK